MTETAQQSNNPLIFYPADSAPWFVWRGRAVRISPDVAQAWDGRAAPDLRLADRLGWQLTPVRRGRGALRAALGIE